MGREEVRKMHANNKYASLGVINWHFAYEEFSPKGAFRRRNPSLQLTEETTNMWDLH